MRIYVTARELRTLADGEEAQSNGSVIVPPRPAGGRGRNCYSCTRWRSLVTDFGPKRGGSQGVCRKCRRDAARERDRVRNGRSGWLDARPLQDFLQERLRDFPTPAHMARAAGVDVSGLTRHVRRRNRIVTLDYADRVLVGLGEHLSDIYPDA